MAITLTVEDGTGLDTANAYVSAADATAYFANRLNDTWANASTDQQAAALIQATQYIDGRYQFRGCQLTTEQALQWPRSAGDWASDTDKALFAWPVQRVKDATCEAALRALSGSLYTDQSAQIVTSEKVDVIQVTYATEQRNGGQTRIAIIDDLLRPLTSSNGYNLQVVRA